MSQDNTKTNSKEVDPSVASQTIAQQQENQANQMIDALFEEVYPYAYAFKADEDLGNIIMSTAKQQKNSVLLLGQPGIGKDRLIAQLAAVTQTTPADVENLSDNQKLDLDKGRVSVFYALAAKNLAEPFINIGDLLRYLVQKHPQTTYFITVDDLGSILRPEINVAGLLMNLISGELANNIRLILPVTKDQYATLNSNQSLADHFSTVRVSSRSQEQAKEILANEIKDIAHYHGVKIPMDTLKYSIKVADQAIKNKVLPGSVIDLIDLASVYAAVKLDKPIVNQEMVDMALGDILELKGHTVTLDSIKDFRDFLNSRIVGQESVVKTITKGIALGRMRLRSLNKPIYSMLAVGKSGVGKTLLAQSIAEYITGDTKNMLRLDMSEFAAAETGVARLIGMPNGYKSSETGGQLTEFVKAHPSAIILLDEFEKANLDVQRLFLQVLDNGQMTTPKGDVVDFTNTIILATSNAGVDAAPTVGFGEQVQTNNQLMEKLAAIFPIELLNRFTDLLEFSDLSKEDLQNIAKLNVDKMLKRIDASGSTLKLTNKQRNSIYEQAAKMATNGRQVVGGVSKIIEGKLLESLED